MTRNVQYNDVVEQDIVDLAENIRAGDRAELRALGGVSPDSALRFSVRVSEGQCAAAHDMQGNIIAIFGVSPISVIGSVGAPWLLGTPLVAEYARELIRASRDFIDMAFEEYDELTNNVWAHNHMSIRYLKALGFTFSGMKQNRLTGADYYTFTKEAPDV